MINWKESQGPLPTFSVITPVTEMRAGARSIEFDFTSISQKDIDGT
jgi:hypothetical protein